MKWFIHTLKNIFTYKGRARRAEFGWFMLTNFLIQIGVYFGSLFIVAVPFAASLGQKPSESLLAGAGIVSILIAVVLIIYQIIIFFASISLTARRLHDLGLSGWWQLLFYVLPIVLVIALSVWISTLPEYAQSAQAEAAAVVMIAGLFISIFYLIFTLVLLFKDGQRCTNRFGEDPKAAELASLLKAAQAQAQSENAHHALEK